MEDKICRFYLPYFQINSSREYLNNEACQLNQDLEIQLPNRLQLKAKMSAILNKVNNDTEIEQEYRRICGLYENETSNSDLSLIKAYEEYINAYHQITSLYIIRGVNNTTYLYVYDTEKETEYIKALEIQETLNPTSCIAKIPNGELFCFACFDKNSYKVSGITLIIDNNYKIRSLPSGIPCYNSSAIYFDRNVYCFGGIYSSESLSLCSRFSLDENRWVNLAPMPQPDNLCSSVIFNRNILISGWENQNLLLYSIDIDSFSTISTEFEKWTGKILINSQERLYLIECCRGSIYESEIANFTVWRRVSETKIEFMVHQAFCSYNKGVLYIGLNAFRFVGNYTNLYYKFSLDEKELIELQDE